MGGYQIPAERQNTGILGENIPRHIVVNRSGGHGSTSLAWQKVHKGKPIQRRFSAGFVGAHQIDANRWSRAWSSSVDAQRRTIRRSYVEGGSSVRSSVRQSTT